MSTNEPFVPTTTANIERANRLFGIQGHPGFLEIVRLSQELVTEAADVCAYFGGWDPQQIVMLKVRMQAAKEHHERLFGKIREAIERGITEDKALRESQTATLRPEKSASEVVETGDHVRREVLTKFAEMDDRIAGSH